MNPVCAACGSSGDIDDRSLERGYGFALFLAAQVGPVTLLIVRSVLRGGRAFAVGLAT
jgi:hypothetical protein